MKFVIFVLSIILVLIGSKCFPDFLTGIFFLSMLISGALLFVDQRSKKK